MPSKADTNVYVIWSDQEEQELVEYIDIWPRYEPVWPLELIAAPTRGVARRIFLSRHPDFEWTSPVHIRIVAKHQDFLPGVIDNETMWHLADSILEGIEPIPCPPTAAELYAEEQHQNALRQHYEEVIMPDRWDKLLDGLNSVLLQHYSFSLEDAAAWGMELKALVDENKALRLCLASYADPKNWARFDEEQGKWVESTDWGSVCFTGLYPARKALGMSS